MKIVERHHTWIHTHFLTDCTRLPSHRMREIENRIIPFLRSLGIVYDIHFEAHRSDPGIRIVLECIPLPHTLELIQIELQRIIQPIPSRPRETRMVTFERPPKAKDTDTVVSDLGEKAPGEERAG